MILSIICPTFNEIKFIDKLIESLTLEQAVDKEIIFVDGGSTDGTRERIDEWKKKYSFIQMIENPKRYVSHGFNMAYKKSNGQNIAFIGAHAQYPPDYFSIAVRYLSSNECDVI